MKNVKASKISDTQLQVLLGYAEEDIYDQSRQATAFGLLKVTNHNDQILKSNRIAWHVFVTSRCHRLVRLPLSGHSVQEACGSRDGAGVEESGHAVHHWQQQHDQSPLPTGTFSSRLGLATVLAKALPLLMLHLLSDLPEVLAGLPPGAEAEGPSELCDVAAAV